MKNSIGICPSCGNEVHTGHIVLLHASGHFYHGGLRCTSPEDRLARLARLAIGSTHLLFPARMAENTRDARRAAEKEAAKNSMFGDED